MLFIIDREAEEIIHLVASVRPSFCVFVCLCSPAWAVWPLTLSHLNRFSNGTEWSILVLSFAKYSKRSIEPQVSYTLKKHPTFFISRSIQNGWAFKMVVVLKGCAIAVDHAFNYSLDMGAEKAHCFSAFSFILDIIISMKYWLLM